jgi:hypothetical protein
MAAVPKTGSIGNITLLQTLKWADSVYWIERNRLIEASRLQAGRGRGGSVRRVVEQSAQADAAPPTPTVSNVSELDLYSPILTILLRDWAQDYRYGEFHAEITAHQGRKDTGGKWTRPDITLATYDSYQFVPGKHFDVITFEVKTFDGLDVTAVYEALAHRRVAHYSFLLVHVPVHSREALESALEDLTYQADDHGVGMVVFADPNDYKTWEFLVEADRNEPDPRDLNDFLDTQITESFKEKIRRWLR